MAPRPPLSTNADSPSPVPPERSPVLPAGEPTRPGWGIPLFLLVVAVALAIQSLVPSLHWPPALHAERNLRDDFGTAALAIAVTLATVAVAWRERRSFADYGFRAGHAVRNCFGGALSGLALLSALVILLHQLDLVVFHGQVLFGAAAQWRSALQWAAVFAVAAYAQESLVHGYLQYAFTRSLRSLLRGTSSPASAVQLAFWIAALLLSLAYALLQRVSGTLTPLALLNATLFSMLMAFSLWRTGSLWWALGYHAAWSWAQSFLWGVPNNGSRIHNPLFFTEATGPALRSGGTTGPMASLYTLGALFAGFGILMLLHRRHVYPDLWHQAAHEASEAAIR